MNDLPSESTEWTRGPWGPGLRKSHQPERGGEPGKEAELQQPEGGENPAESMKGLANGVSCD